MALLWAAGVALVLALCTAGARGDTYCAPPGVSNVTIASRTHVCVVFNGVARAYFTPEADKMTRLQFNGTYKLLPDLNSTLNATTGPGMIQMQAQQGALTPTFLPPNDTVPFPRDYYVSIAVSSFNVTGPSRIYKRITYGGMIGNSSNITVNTIPIITAIVECNKGVVQSISYDDGCFFCNSGTEQCQHYGLNATTMDTDTIVSTKSCTELQSNCDSTTHLCDLKVFVVWSGSDADGNYFRSAGLRFSRYLSFGLDSLYTNTLNAADSAFNKARLQPGLDN